MQNDSVAFGHYSQKAWFHLAVVFFILMKRSFLNPENLDVTVFYSVRSQPACWVHNPRRAPWRTSGGALGGPSRGLSGAAHLAASQVLCFFLFGRQQAPPGAADVTQEEEGRRRPEQPVLLGKRKNAPTKDTQRQSRASLPQGPAGEPRADRARQAECSRCFGPGRSSGSLQVCPLPPSLSLFPEGSVRRGRTWQTWGHRRGVPRGSAAASSSDPLQEPQQGASRGHASLAGRPRTGRSLHARPPRVRHLQVGGSVAPEDKTDSALAGLTQCLLDWTWAEQRTLEINETRGGFFRKSTWGVL
ncbi:uncharacterized protein LOC116574309 [Mustela erminea]|uniref:uncharacterized protein LOC116574309 n=1 Tax=Mustela erminea TaxID=36723 RepID=UPI0013867860|nr:uncharacterized protein LOC116574309 [Mustela erminea]